MKREIKKYLFIFMMIIINFGCISGEKSILFPGNNNNSKYNFEQLNIPKENWELKSFSYGGVENYGLYVKGKAGVNDALKDRIVIFFHGNGGRIDKYTPVEMANFFYENGINYFAMEYRGYGQSENFKTSETSTYEDGEFGYNYLLGLDNGKYKEGNIIIMGHSLGSAVAIDLAVKKSEKALITMSAFTSFSNEFNDLTSFDIPGNWITNAKYDNLSKIDKVNSPVLILHGHKDTMVKQDNSEKLYNSAVGEKKLCIIPDAAHDDIGIKLNDEAKKSIMEYISR